MHSATAELWHHLEKCHVEVAHYHLDIVFFHQIGKVRPERFQPLWPIVLGEHAVHMHNHDVVLVAQETYVGVGLDFRDEHARVCFSLALFPTALFVESVKVPIPMHELDGIASLRSQPYEHAAVFSAAEGEVLVRLPCLQAALFCARYCGLAF